VILLANAVGAVGLAFAVVFSGHAALHEGEVARTAVAIGVSKANEPFMNAFFKGVLGNLLIAMGVWIAMAGRSVTDKVLGPWLPIAMLPIAVLSIAGVENRMRAQYREPVLPSHGGHSM